MAQPVAAPGEAGQPVGGLPTAAATAAPRLSPATPGSMRFHDPLSQLPAGVTRPYAAGATRV